MLGIYIGFFHIVIVNNRSIVAMCFFHPLVTFLGFDVQGGDGPCLEPAQTDWFAGFFTETEGLILNTL
jgi:hypothetical protein